MTEVTHVSCTIFFFSKLRTMDTDTTHLHIIPKVGEKKGKKTCISVGLFLCLGRLLFIFTCRLVWLNGWALIKIQNFNLFRSFKFFCLYFSSVSLPFATRAYWKGNQELHHIIEPFIFDLKSFFLAFYCFNILYAFHSPKWIQKRDCFLILFFEIFISSIQRIDIWLWAFEILQYEFYQNPSTNLLADWCWKINHNLFS